MSASADTVKAASDVVTIEINGRALTAKKGSMVIQAADAAGIYIPRFCYHHKLPIAANCRMCLVEIEKAPKPMPACATPVAEGMKVYTRSKKARESQNAVMEFLLINHPLDCPVCDQGGECPLQDQALGYGRDVSHYDEKKRVVPDQSIGPLITTYMTRCIHCTRCVRFGQELAGVMEFGGLGRGEHMEIRTFLDRSVDSELSGNVIDLCPVGALTSKPFQFKGRPWELDHHASIAPHDCVGSNVDVQTRRGQVLRVLPRANEAVNEIWLSDRDRFSYEGLNSRERLTRPMIRRDGRWDEVDWTAALAHAVQGIKRAIERHGAEQIGALASPTATVEEFYLLQKLVRALGSGSVDHRLRQADFSDDENLPLFPWLGQSIAELERLDAALLIGANPRKDQPLIGLRLRKSAQRGARITAVNPLDYDFTYRLAAKLIAGPGGFIAAVAAVAKAVLERAGAKAPAGAEWLAKGKLDDGARAVAEQLAHGEKKAVLIGAYATSDPQSATLRAAAELIAKTAGARLGYLPEANSAGAWLAGAVPHRGPLGAKPDRAGRATAQMLRDRLKAYLLLGVEPELDCINAGAARAAMGAAEFVVMLSSFKPVAGRSPAVEYANVLLPLAPFTETDGSFVNVEGRAQRFSAATQALGDARPGWKILRVLGGLLGLPGFEQADIAEVQAELALEKLTPSATLANWRMPAPSAPPPLSDGQLYRIAEVPIYAADPIVRRAPALQATADNPPPAARVNAREAARMKLGDGDTVLLRMVEGDARLAVAIDERVPDQCVLVAAGYLETSTLGAHGPVTLVKGG